MKKIKQLFIYVALLSTSILASCEKGGDPDSTNNPAEATVVHTKAASKNTSAILLCSFGSTFEESIKTLDALENDFKEAFPRYDIYLSFTSRTCVNRVEAVLNTPRYQPDLWLNAIGNAGYDSLIVQSLHVIPGEEYLSLMNTDVKKDFMITNFHNVKVLKGDCLLEGIETGVVSQSVKDVAKILTEKYKTQFDDPKHVVIHMGHGNPDESYAANDKYLETEDEMNALLTHKNAIMGTVDYGPTLFFDWDDTEATLNDVLTLDKYKDRVYRKIEDYFNKKKADGAVTERKEITISLVSFMTVAGDHTHNDLLGQGEVLEDVNTAPNGDASWRARLEELGYTISDIERHKTDAATCDAKGLADFPEIRKLWIDRLNALVADDSNWEDGVGYQLEE